MLTRRCHIRRHTYRIVSRHVLQHNKKSSKTVHKGFLKTAFFPTVFYAPFSIRPSLVHVGQKNKNSILWNLDKPNQIADTCFIGRTCPQRKKHTWFQNQKASSTNYLSKASFIPRVRFVQGVFGARDAVSAHKNRFHNKIIESTRDKKQNGNHQAPVDCFVSFLCLVDTREQPSLTIGHHLERCPMPTRSRGRLNHPGQHGSSGDCRQKGWVNPTPGGLYRAGGNGNRGDGNRKQKKEKAHQVAHLPLPNDKDLFFSLTRICQGMTTSDRSRIPTPELET